MPLADFGGPRLDGSELFAVAESLRREADELLVGRGLRDVLARYGEPVPVGSYALNLMVYRDLDVYVIREAPDIAAFFALGAEIAGRMRPHRLHFRNELDFDTEGLPKGFYWGVHMGDAPTRTWKIDVWGMDAVEYRRHAGIRMQIAARLDSESRRVILAIKSALFRNPEYRKVYGGYDIYCAVLDGGVRDVAGFHEYLRSHPSECPLWRR